MVRRRVIEDIFKCISMIVGFSDTSIAASHIDETNVKEYYSVLQAMGLAEGLRIDSPFEDVSEVWMSNGSMIQECESISFAGESIPKLPYNALNEMRSLVELDISGNKSLTIDPKKFMFLQERLTVINFSFCRMSPETFNAILNCRRLKKLNFYNTSFKGILDSDNYSWGNLKKTLVELDISRSDLTIKTIDRVAELESLRILNASDNKIGNLSDWLGIRHHSNLTGLSLFWDLLTSIADSIDDLLSLIGLSLFRNRLPSIPNSIGNLKNLAKLNLRANRLENIPESIGDLPNLTELDLSDNRLESIPKSIGNLKNLTGLYLYSNKLTSIPESIGDLPNLTELDLSDNRLESIPKSIGNLKNLTGLYLYSNKLTSIPESIGDLSNLTELDLSNNMLTSVPSTIKNLRNTLDYVNIRNNNIIPRSNHENSLGKEQLKEIFGDKLYVE